MAGEGSVFRRRSDGRWVAQIRHGARGEVRTLRRYAKARGREGREEAKRLLEELVAEGAAVRPSTSVGAYLRSWIARSERRLKPSTMRTYRSIAERHIVPAIGHLTLGELSVDHVEVTLAGLRLAPKGQRNVLALLSRVLSVAERRGLVRRNVARLVEPPRSVRVDRPALAVVEARRILVAVTGDRLEALYIVALASGLRMGELLGLRWADWDRDGRTLRVAGALARVDGRYVLDEPKTPGSIRTVVLPTFAAAALEAHRTRQLEERVAAGVPTEEGLIFTTPIGRPISGGWLTHRWRRLSRAAGLDLRFHDLRHGQASLLVAQGVHPRVVAERLGHSTIRMAMDRYAHVGRDLDRAAADLLDEAFRTA